MSIRIDPRWFRLVALGGACALGLAQVGCAHPLVGEPSVVISSRIGHAPVYAQIGVPPPVVVLPPPRVIYVPPPRVLYAPAPAYQPHRPGWGHGHGRPMWRGQWHRDGQGHEAYGQRPGWRR